MAGALEGVSSEAVIGRQQTADGFTVTLRQEQAIVHRYLMTSEGGSMLHWLEIGYPESLASKYGSIAGKMMASFRTVAGETSGAPNNRWAENAVAGYHRHSTDRLDLQSRCHRLCRSALACT
jgi:hypothetical protein